MIIIFPILAQDLYWLSQGKPEADENHHYPRCCTCGRRFPPSPMAVSNQWTSSDVYPSSRPSSSDECIICYEGKKDNRIVRMGKRTGFRLTRHGLYDIPKGPDALTVLADLPDEPSVTVVGGWQHSKTDLLFRAPIAFGGMDGFPALFIPSRKDAMVWNQRSTPHTRPVWFPLSGLRTLAERMQEFATTGRPLWHLRDVFTSANPEKRRIIEGLSGQWVRIALGLALTKPNENKEGDES